MSTTKRGVSPPKDTNSKRRNWYGRYKRTSTDANGLSGFTDNDMLHQHVNISPGFIPSETLPVPMKVRNKPSKAKDVKRKWFASRSLQPSTISTKDLPSPKRVKHTPVSSPSRARFERAFSKALATMTKRVGTLSRSQWLKLRNAVRKQVSLVHQDSTSVAIRRLTQQVEGLQRLLPSEYTTLQDRVLLLTDQVQILRRQVLDFIEEKDGISETCPHVIERKKMTISKTPKYFSLTCANDSLEFGHNQELSGSTIVACKSCTIKREEFVFYRTGISIDTFSTIRADDTEKWQNYLSSNKLTRLPPLSLQFIWLPLLEHLISRWNLHPSTHFA